MTDEDTRVKLDTVSLRGFPFLEIRNDRISDRAYFLWKSGAPGDHLSHWLSAEADEVAEQAEGALVFPAGCDRFLRDYTLIDYVRFATMEPHEPRYIGARSPRMCTLCESPRATFRCDAHVLPALTGCRWLLTYDECDDCNLRYGSSLEDDLGKMLLPTRVIGRLPGRKGASTKLKRRKTGGSLGGQGTGEPLAMNIRPEDDSIALEHLDPNTIRVTLKGMPYYPMRALRSLARVMWHLLPADLRSEHSELRAWIRGDRAIAPLSYYSGFVPGAGLRHTTFALWRSNDGAQLVCFLAIGTGLLLMSTPNWLTGEQREFPLPPLPTLGDGMPSLTRITLRSDAKEINPTTTYTIAHASRRSTWEGETDVVCTIASAHRNAAFQASCTVKETAHGGLIYAFSGGDIIGQLVVTLGSWEASDEGAEQQHVHFTYNLAEGGAHGDVSKTHNLLLALFEGGRLIAKRQRPEWFVLDATSPGVPEAPAPEVLWRALSRRQSGAIGATKPNVRPGSSQ